MKLYAINQKISYCDYGIVYISESKIKCEDWLKENKTKYDEYFIVEFETEKSYTIHNMFGLTEGGL